MTTLLDIRHIVERQTDTLENESIVIWCNEAQAEFAVSINIPTSTTLSINPTDLEYTEPAGLQVITRMWLQSDRDKGYDKEFTWLYRRYNGKLIFQYNFTDSDTLHVEYSKHLTYFSDVMDEIELEDRYIPLYTSYCTAMYYDLPSVIERLGEQQARKRYETNFSRYMSMKSSVIATYSLQSEPVVIKERW